MNNNKEVITKKDLNKISWRYILGSQLNWNYERMMSSGYLYGIMPVLKKLYKDDKELKDMAKTHNQFFNTNAIFGNLIMGIDVAIEEKEGYKAKETVAALKTALMGSLAGVGDSLFHVIWGTILGVTVIGALIPTVIKVATPLVYTNNGVKLEMQATLDGILPALIPVLLTLLTYWMLGQKKLNSTRVIWLVLIFTIVLSALGILGLPVPPAK